MSERKNAGKRTKTIDLRTALVWTVFWAVLLSWGVPLFFRASGSGIPQLAVSCAVSAAGAVLCGLRIRTAPAAGGGASLPRRLDGKGLILSLLLAFCVISCLNELCGYFLSSGSSAAGSTVNAGSGSLPEQLLAVLALAILPAFYEEFLMRGILFRGLRSVWSFWPAALVSAAFWAVWHGDWNQAVVAFGTGLVLALLYEVYRSLPLVIGIHLANNLISLYWYRLAKWMPGLVQGGAASGYGGGNDAVLMIAEALVAVWLFRKIMTGEKIRRRV